MNDPVGHTRPSLARVAAVMARHANLTLGGGSATIATLHAELVGRRRWITEAELQLAYALSRLTPGTNLLAFCAAVGRTVRGVPGALVALVAASIPCSLLVVAATRFYEAWQASPWFHAALSGALAAAVAVTVRTAWVIAAPHVKSAPRVAAVIAPAAVGLVTLGGLSPLHVLVLAAVVGLLWPARGEAP